MAVQILNDMPDAAVNRGDPDFDLLSEINTRRVTPRFTGRAIFMAATIALHAIAAVAIVSMRNEARVATASEPIIATMLEAPPEQAEAPPEYVPPSNVVYAFEAPPDLSFESDAITPEVTPVAIATPHAQSVAPPMVEEIDYVRAPAPVYPRESQRGRERGTVLLRVLVDVFGRPAEIQIERSSGYARLDAAARVAVEKALFRPHEVNGVAQPAQVLIPIEFTRRSS
jgi:protein TonB